MAGLQWSSMKLRSVSSKALPDNARKAGLAFIPIVAEAHGGGWGTAAMKLWRALGAAAADKDGLECSRTIALLQQRLSATLQRENACAVVRRLSASQRHFQSACPSAWGIKDEEEMKWQ